MNNGWICPKCGRVYAPFIPECQYCNEKVESISSNTIIWNENQTGISNAEWQEVFT